jgi:hypothetical protein
MLVFDPLYLYLGRLPRPGAKSSSSLSIFVRVAVFLLLMIGLAAGPWIPAAWTGRQIAQLRSTTSQLESNQNYAAALPVWTAGKSSR